MLTRSALILVVIALLPHACLAQWSTTASSDSPTYFVIPIKGVIGTDFSAARMKALLQQATSLNATIVVLDIETPGGSTIEAERIVDLLIEHKRTRVVAFVRKALSAGATITLACREIYMSENATIGAAVSYMQDSDGEIVRIPADVAEKFQSAWRAVCRKAAEHGGHSPLLGEAMVDPDFSLTMQNIEGKIVVERGGQGELLKEKGRILTLTAREAEKCGLSSGTVGEIAAIGQKIGLANWRSVRRDEEVTLVKPVQFPRPNELTPAALYESMISKAGGMKLLDPSITQLQRRKAVDEWEAWLDKQISNSLRVAWQVELLDAATRSSESEVARLKAIVKSLDLELKNTTVGSSGIPGYEKYERQRVQELKLRLARYSRLLRAATDYPLGIMASCPDNSKILIMGRVSKASETFLSSLSKKSLLNLSGCISDVEFRSIGHGDFAMIVYLQDCSAQAVKPGNDMDPLSKDKAVAESRLGLATTYLKAGKTKMAKEILQQIIASFPKTASAERAEELMEQIAAASKPATQPN